MTKDEINYAIKILGVKIVNCVMRMSDGQLDKFEIKLNEMLESKKQTAQPIINE